MVYFIVNIFIDILMWKNNKFLQFISDEGSKFTLFFTNPFYYLIDFVLIKILC